MDLNACHPSHTSKPVNKTSWIADIKINSQFDPHPTSKKKKKNNNNNKLQNYTCHFPGRYPTPTNLLKTVHQAWSCIIMVQCAARVPANPWLYLSLEPDVLRPTSRLREKKLFNKSIKLRSVRCRDISISLKYRKVWYVRTSLFTMALREPSVIEHRS